MLILGAYAVDEAGVGVDGKNSPETSPLSAVADARLEEVVRLLLDRGAAVDHRERRDWVPPRAFCLPPNTNALPEALIGIISQLIIAFVCGH